MALISVTDNLSLYYKIILYFIATTGLEFVSGIISKRFFNVELWDYSDQKFNYKGHICLLFSFYWIVLAFAFEYLLSPLYINILALFSFEFKEQFSLFFGSFIFVELIIVSIKNIIFADLFSEKNRLALMPEFLKEADDLLADPMVKKLSDYKHHRDKNRLDHVTEVAWVSFIWGKKFLLDTKAIVRGALLHDLFYYDWFYEGPALHGLRHHNIALSNARKLTDLSKKEEDIIKKHMWPLTIWLPMYRESLLVSIVDTFCSFKDYITSCFKE